MATLYEQCLQFHLALEALLLPETDAEAEARLLETAEALLLETDAEECLLETAFDEPVTGTGIFLDDGEYRRIETSHLPRSLYAQAFTVDVKQGISIGEAIAEFVLEE